MAKDFNSNIKTGKDPIIAGSTDMPPAPQGRITASASLRVPNFRLLLTGSILSNASQWIQSVTLSWLVYNLTGSGTMLGSVNLVRTLASVGMIPLAGLLIDRLNRRKLITIENSWLFAITLTLGILLVFGRANIWYLFIFAFMGGMVQTIDMTLRQVLISI